MTRATTERIEQFQGEYRFLSNFWPAVVEYEGLIYMSVEHAYQAAKTTDVDKRRLFTAPGVTPGQAKRLGRKFPVRPDWEAVKIRVMEELVRKKFREPELRWLLSRTGNAVLEEGNTWGDRFWGISPPGSGDGRNELGKILMRVREEAHRE